MLFLARAKGSTVSFFPEDILPEYKRLYTDLGEYKKNNSKKIGECKKKYDKN